MQRKKLINWLVATSVVLVAVGACTSHHFRSDYKDANALLHGTNELESKPFLKAHLKAGDVVIFSDSWQVDTASNFLSGSGTRYNFNREKTFQGKLAVPIDSIAIFETNQKIKYAETGRLMAVGILTAVDVALSLYCLSNPKACFGSCPTFYLDPNQSVHFADAEGFSNAIAPSLEYTDIDALHTASLANQKELVITMKNEALETHCIKTLYLLACERAAGEQVYQSTSNRFYRSSLALSPIRAMADEGEITQLLAQQDRLERFSPADGENLSSKEEVLLEFEPAQTGATWGLAINFRQSLMTTYFIYSALGYMGDDVSDLFAQLETSPELQKKLGTGIAEELGDIEVWLWNESTNTWEDQGGFYETGPIAANLQMLPLKTNSTSPNRIKLVLNKGLWRMDAVQLVKLDHEVIPHAIAPSNLTNKGKSDQNGYRLLLHPEKHLISMPGSEYQIRFELPKPNQDYQVFLSSTGYYLEWMREYWLKEKDLFMLKKMMDHPRAYLKNEAASYKEYERTMEQVFWESRIDTKNFAYDEN